MVRLVVDLQKTGPNHRLETDRAEERRPAVHPVVSRIRPL